MSFSLNPIDSLIDEKMITLTLSAPQCRPHNNMKGGKLRGQLIADHNVTTQMEGFVPMGMYVSVEN